MNNLSNYVRAKARADEIDQNIIEVLKSGRSFLVEAGAGSGKTYSLHKVVAWIDEHRAKEFQKRSQRVACITYTNAAVDVIRKRISSNSFIVPSTIHTFAWENIKNFKSSLRVGISELNIVSGDESTLSIADVVYDTGVRYIKNNQLHLFHSDVIGLFAWFLEKPKFRRLLQDRFPLILIDEYQDSFKSIIDKFITYYISQKKGPQFGLFGDSWQTIYASTGACGAVSNENLIEIKKEANFRSQQIIVDALNQIRPELPQISAIDENDGSIKIITTNQYSGSRIPNGYYKGDLQDNVLEQYISSVEQKLKSTEWEGSSKVLMISHKLLAKHQKYPKLLTFLDDHLKNQDDKYFLFFKNTLEPLYAAAHNLDVKQMYEVLKITRPPVETKHQKKLWKELTEQLCLARKSSIYEVLRTALQSRLIPIPPDIEADMARYDKGEDFEYYNSTISQFYQIQYEEVIHAVSFFKEDALYSTEHGVKGEEYDNILLIMGKGWNMYKFEETLYMNEKELSAKDLNGYIRNRNLFYVCCSRPQKRLAILITVKINKQFQDYLNRVFGASNVVEYNDFISKQ